MNRINIGLLLILFLILILPLLYLNHFVRETSYKCASSKKIFIKKCIKILSSIDKQQQQVFIYIYVFISLWLIKIIFIEDDADDDLWCMFF